MCPFLGNIGLSLGVVIACVCDNRRMAATFGAALTAVIAVQKAFPFEPEAVRYGVAITKCKRMLNTPKPQALDIGNTWKA